MLPRIAVPVALLAIALPANAVPEVVAHQGRLVTEDGDGLEGVTTVTFSLYGAADALNPLWTEQQTIVPDNGFYAVALGAETAFPRDLWDGRPLWFGIEPEGLPETRTEWPLSAVPYARTAYDVIGGRVDVSEIRIGGDLVIDSDGNFRGEFQGGLGGLDCGPDEVPVFDGAVWRCTEHEVRTADDVRTVVEGLPLSLADGATVGGAPIATLPVPWLEIADRPAGLDDGDDDSWAEQVCPVDHHLVSTPDGWACVDDAFATVDDMTAFLDATPIHAATADHATTADSAAEAEHAITAESASEADHAASADTAAEAEHAATADSATHADSAELAERATEADHAVTAETATEADRASEADHASTAESADHASTADTATQADHAATADSANQADHASTAESADHASTADSATQADRATTAGRATTADTATHATTATSAETAAEADHATTADTADTAGFATDAGHARTADSASRASTASNADTLDGYDHSHFARPGTYTMTFDSCGYSACTDAPALATCPAGEVAIGVAIAEMNDNETPCGNLDDYRLYCCRLRVTVPAR